MTSTRLDEILSRFPEVAVAVVGDFFLDKYLVLDRSLTEVSLETGREAYQVMGVRQRPGAAGAVCNNLAALGVGRHYAVGLTGDDGAGYELRQGLAEQGVALHYLCRTAHFMTPTYMKPMERLPGDLEQEMNRLDIKNRIPLAREAEEMVLADLREVTTRAQGLVIVDQVQERNCGVITNRVREELSRFSSEQSGLVILVDSRVRAGEYRGVMLKPNREEAQSALGLPASEDDTVLGQDLSRQTGRPVFLTRGVEGILVCTAEEAVAVPAVEVSGPVDIVGAGDSVLAGLTLSLCAGASLVEAAVVGNITASITVQQLGTTGTATPEQVRQRFQECADLYAPF